MVQKLSGGYRDQKTTHHAKDDEDDNRQFHVRALWVSGQKSATPISKMLDPDGVTLISRDALASGFHRTNRRSRRLTPIG